MTTRTHIVLKFGGSVLHSPADFERITREINRYRSEGTKVVAVVSAFFGVTEQLIQEANGSGLDETSVAYAELIASGEFKSASSLTEHLLSQQVASSVLAPNQLGFIASGPRTEARPITINTMSILDAFLNSDVLVVPGFSAIDQQGGCVLLGRGGSDISAVCIAQALSLNSVRLLKDVDGLYDLDPNKFTHAQRQERVSYEMAKRIGGELIQAEAIDFAASKEVYIDVASIGQTLVSRIGRLDHKEDEPSPAIQMNDSALNEAVAR